MRALLTSFNLKHGLNPLVSRLFDPLHEFTRAKGPDDCDVVFLSFIDPVQDFIPDMQALERVTARNLPCIVFDHSETFRPNFIFGVDKMPEGSAYWILSDVASRHLNIKGYFKRELLAGHTQPDCPFPIFPLDWTLKASAVPKIDTEEEFHKRPIDIFFSWGYSSESRPKLYGELMRQAVKFCAHFTLTEQDVDRALAEGHERIFALLFTPHFRRINIHKIFDWQQKSKISISMFGRGMKCFRCAEASYNCVMAQQGTDYVEWSYPWVSKENCLMLPNGEHCAGIDLYRGGIEFKRDGRIPEEIEAVDWLYRALRLDQGSLYPIYLKGIENNRRYLNDTYAREYILPKILEVLK